MCPWPSICFHGPSGKFLDLLPPAARPPVQKRDAQHMILQHRGSHTECWISGNHRNHENDRNHGNSGFKQWVTKQRGLEIPESMLLILGTHSLICHTESSYLMNMHQFQDPISHHLSPLHFLVGDSSGLIWRSCRYSKTFHIKRGFYMGQTHNQSLQGNHPHFPHFPRFSVPHLGNFRGFQVLLRKTSSGPYLMWKERKSTFSAVSSFWPGAARIANWGQSDWPYLDRK